jgi:hypothetical protein
MKHRARTHTWINGILRTVEHEFELLEDAIEFIGKTPAHVIKIFNEFGELVISEALSVIPDEINVREYSYV